MNKMIKGFIIASFVSIILGFAIMAGVAACGGTGTVKAVMDSGGVGWDENGFHIGDMVVGNSVIVDTDIDMSTAEEVTFAADELEDLEIHLEAGVFEIKEDAVDQIIVKSSQKVKVSDSGEKLSIKTPDRIKVFGFWHDDAQKVEITLPKGQEFHTIELEIGAGELDVEALNAENIILELGAGRIEIKEYQCEKADIRVGAGEMIVHNGIAGNMDLQVGMGDFQFRGDVTNELDAECGMGNMDITLASRETDYNYKIDCGMGNVSIGNTSYGGAVSSKEIDNNAEADFDLECGMGNISIYFMNER